jgi:hypothetical protein
MSRGREDARDTSEKRFTAIWARGRANRDLLGSGATRDESSSRKNEFVRDGSPFFWARGEILEGTQASETLTTTATPEKLPATRGSEARAGGAASIASGRWPLAPRSPTQAEYDC